MDKALAVCYIHIRMKPLFQVMLWKKGRSEMEKKKKHGAGFYLVRNLILTLLAGAVSFYVMLPALNYKDFSTYIWVLALIVLFLILQGLSLGVQVLQRRFDDPNVVEIKPKKMLSYWTLKIPAALAALILVAAVLGHVSSMVFFRATDYAAMLKIEDGDFTTDVQQISFDQIPMLDKESAERLGDRKLGELSDMVSQFEVNPAYSQINFQDEPVRVTYLDYGDIIKWLNNREEGLPAYIRINMVSQEVTVERLEEGIKYSPSDLFSRDLMRHLRFQFPTLMFDDVNFEINEEGHPFWICSVVDKTIGLFGGTDVIGAVIVDAVTGESVYHTLEDVPTWVDRVFSADLIIEQYDYRGMYSGGFINSVLGQKNVTVTTDGYNYIALNDDVWVYTGVTSVTGDESNVGFILSNQRTKETAYYTIAGATEYSAMASAQGMVQHLGYTATFPLLLNINGEPTYFMALKDASLLVKMYAMVNVEQYQVVATGTTLEETKAEYDAQLIQNGIQTVPVEEAAETVTISGEVEALRTQIVEGNTIYYFLLEGQWYSVSAAQWEEAIFLEEGVLVTVTVESDAEGQIIPMLEAVYGEE